MRHAILSAGGIGEDGSLLVFHPEEADFSRVVIDCAENVIVAADHTKFQGQGLVKVCSASRVDVLVTDRPLPDQVEQHLIAEEIAIRIA